MDFMITKSFVIWRLWKCGCLSPTSNMQLYYLLACRRRMTHTAFKWLGMQLILLNSFFKTQAIPKVLRN